MLLHNDVFGDRCVTKQCLPYGISAFPELYFWPHTSSKRSVCKVNARKMNYWPWSCCHSCRVPPPRTASCSTRRPWPADPRCRRRPCPETETSRKTRELTRWGFCLVWLIGDRAGATQLATHITILGKLAYNCMKCNPNVPNSARVTTLVLLLLSCAEIWYTWRNSEAVGGGKGRHCQFQL